MNDGGESITLSVHNAISEIAPEAWDAGGGDISPTVSHVFLKALEESGSTTGRTGWAPQHLTFAGKDGRLVGAVPLYLKSHSYGEYVFDWGWADAYERSGGRYYPKLLCAGPFTPGPGPRLLIAPGAPAETQGHLVAARVEVTPQPPTASLLCHFPGAADIRRISEAGVMRR